MSYLQPNGCHLHMATVEEQDLSAVLLSTCSRVSLSYVITRNVILYEQTSIIILSLSSWLNLWTNSIFEVYSVSASMGQCAIYICTIARAKKNQTIDDRSSSLLITPSFLVYKARWNMTRSSKRYFDYLFVIYYITYDYKFIIIVNYIWSRIQSYKIYIIKIKN